MGEVVMPRLSDSMEEGTVLKWLKAEGDQVQRGDALVEIETDKATMTYEADSDGQLRIVAAEGETLAIGAVIAHLGADADAATRGARVGHAGPANGGTQIDPPGHGVSTEPVPEVATVEAGSGSGSGTIGAPSPVPLPTTAVRPNDGARLKASPLARRIARELSVDLGALEGSGPGGRIVRADVQAAADIGPADSVPAPERPSPDAAPVAVGALGEGTARGEMTIVPLTRVQQVVARRMAESRATVPDFTLQSEVDMEGCVLLRDQFKELNGAEVPSYNDMVVKACAIALREFPRANGSYRDGHFELHARVNVGVAVAAQDGLVVPVVHDADLKSLSAIAGQARVLATRVRQGAVTPPELSGGTFTVSNLGMYGVSSFTAVINPPQAAILAVGALAQRPVVREGAIVARHTMHVTLACDHRILYGADAALFLARVRELLQAPLALVL